MASESTPTLVPESPIDELSPLPSTRKPVSFHEQETKILFDSIAQEGIGIEERRENTSLKLLLSGLLWFGYAVALIVALALVWSAGSHLMSLSR